MEALKQRREYLYCAPVLGLCSALPSLVSGWQARTLTLFPFLMAVLGWLLLRPARWMALFFAGLLLTPPLPAPIGDAGIHIAPAIVLLGILSEGLRLAEWRTSFSPLALAFGAFTLILLASSALAGVYSGDSLALGSLARVLLFGIGIYLFVYASMGPELSPASLRKLTAVVFLIACAAALFACADFYFQFPAPARFEAQFVWLDTGIFRRAQGLFYEASTLGNFCAFFLVMIVVALFRREDSPCSRFFLLGGGAVLTIAMILSYSRGSILNVAVALVALLCIRRAGAKRFWRLLPVTGISVIGVVFSLHLALPAFSASYWERMVNSLTYFWYSPDGVLSGRLNNWYVLGLFLIREPWHAVFGVGYKTLAYSTFLGAPLIADNTYLSVLAETGLAGLTSFAVLNVMILRCAWRAARSTVSATAFYGEWIFCFWIGELMQMLSGDLITYWRVLPVYFWVLGIAVRKVAEEQ